MISSSLLKLHVRRQLEIASVPQAITLTLVPPVVQFVLQVTLIVKASEMVAVCLCLQALHTPVGLSTVLHALEIWFTILRLGCASAIHLVHHVQV